MDDINISNSLDPRAQSDPHVHRVICGAGDLALDPGLLLLVHVEPIEVDIAVEDGAVLMDAAERLGFTWPSVCGGEGACTACAVTIVAGLEHVEPPAAAEVSRLAEIGRSDPEFRLACQLRVRGPVRVRKRGVRRSALQ